MRTDVKENGNLTFDQPVIWHWREIHVILAIEQACKVSEIRLRTTSSAATQNGRLKIEDMCNVLERSQNA